MKRIKTSNLSYPVCPHCGKSYMGDIGKHGLYLDDLNGQMLATCEKSDCGKSFFAEYQVVQIWDVSKRLPPRLTKGKSKEEIAALKDDLQLRDPEEARALLNAIQKAKPARPPLAEIDDAE